MTTITTARAGPIRTAKTPKRVRFAGEDRDETRLIRQQEAEKRDARNLPRVDVDVTTSYDIPALSTAAGALFGYAKTTLNSAKSTLENVVELGKSALTSSFTSSFGKISLSFSGDRDQAAPAQQQQSSMLEYPPFIAGATPNVVKKNRRDYYQSRGVMSSMKQAKSYAPGSTPARTPDHMQSDKEKSWYRFHETPYAGHKLDFGRGRSLTSLRPPSKPEYRFESPTRNASKRKTPKSSAKKQQRSAMKKRLSKAKLGDVVPRRSNAEEFHANFSGRERNELYASYTRFLTAIRFDVKQFARDLRELRLPTDTILKIHERMKRSDWDFFMRIMADEEYWAQVKGVGSTKVPIVPVCVDPQSKRGKVFPCEYCQPHEWAGKVEVREIENEGDEIPVQGHTKFDEPYTHEELAHIEAGRYFKVFHRFCHESRYDWKFPDPSKPCSWEGQNHPNAKEGQWSISKYDPRLRHFPLYMQKVPKRVRQIQQDLHDMVTILTLQDRAAWLYIQGIRRHNTRMASLLDKMDLERKRRQVFWPCQMQVKIHIKNKPELHPEPEVIQSIDEDPVTGQHKRAHSPDVEIQADTDEVRSKRARFLIDKQGVAGDVIANGNYKKTSIEDGVEDIRTNQAHQGPEEHSRKRTRTPPSSFGLFSEDEETEDDEQTQRVREWERQRVSKQPRPKLTWLQKLDATMKEREAELAAQEAENTKAEAEKVATKPPTPKETDTVPPILPSVPTTVPAPAPAKPFVFEDPSPTQEQTIPTDNERNPLKEHTNGVKPSPATAVPNLFGSAVPNLAPTGFHFGQTNAASPLKPAGAPTSTVNTGLYGNEENIPTATASAQAPSPAASTSAPVPPAAPASTNTASAPSILAQKAPAPEPVFKFAVPAAPPTSLSFSASGLAAPASVVTTTAPAPSIFAQEAPVSATTEPVFKFAVPPAPAVPSTGLFCSAPAPAATVAPTNEISLDPPQKNGAKDRVEPAVAPKPAASSIFSGLSAASAASGAPALSLFPAKAPDATNIFNKPAEAAAMINFPKPASNTNLFGNLGGVSAASLANAATTAAPTFSTFSTSAPVPTSATTTSVLFGSVLATAPAEAPRAYSFGSNTAAVPKVDFGVKPVPPASFNFTSTVPAALTANTFNFVAGGVKPAEPAVGNLFTKSAATSAPSTEMTAAPTMTTSFPTSNNPFFFEGSSAAPATNMSQSFPPTTPQAPPPSMLFGGFKPQDTPIKHSPGNKFNEDISMASPEQSPEKPSPKTGVFGATTNSMANGNVFGQNKPFFPAAPAAPSPLGKLNFQAATQPAVPSAPSFGAPVSQPAVGMQASTAPIASAPVNFNFGSFQSMPGAPAPASTTSAAAPAPTFQFDAAGIDLNPNSPAMRKHATPRRRGGKR